MTQTEKPGEKILALYELMAPCHFGLEAVLKREIQDLGYEVSEVENGRVTFRGDAKAVCRANIFLRTAERVLLKVGDLRRGPLMSCSRRRRPSRGRCISRRMQSAG